MSLISLPARALKNSYFLLKALSNFRHRSRLERNGSTSHRINVLGNGPSLACVIEKHPDCGFRGDDSICVNDFATTDGYEKIQPGYYVLFDPCYWEENITDQLRSRRKNIFDSLTRKTSWPLKLFLPIGARRNREIQALGANQNIRTIFINDSQYHAAQRIRFYLYRNNLALPHIQNVLVACIFIAINLGYKEIFLYGADHSWTETLCVNQDNIVCLRDTHFYDRNTPVLTPWLKDARTSFRMDEILFALGRMFEGYRTLSDYADYMDAKIYNASQKSFIDAFDRV